MAKRTEKTAGTSLPPAEALRDAFPDWDGSEPRLSPPPDGPVAHAPEEDDFEAGIPPPPAEPDLAALRALLLSREIALIDRLRERLSNPLLHARDVSQVIAEALLLRAGKDDKLAHALEPVVEGIVKNSLRKNPSDFTNVLFPVMGPAIRRSIAEGIRGMLEGFNKSVEMAFSWKGLRWRLEAMHSGKPFSEIVLLNTLVYRVEQIFLIHAATGLVLAHETGEDVDSQDADMVSAMLTAIQDFVNDCFARGRKGELESMHLGGYTILVEKGEYAYLACVVRGTPPADFGRHLRTSLELISVEFSAELENFTGNNAPFLLARRHFDDLMTARFVDENKPLPLWVKALPVLLLLTLAAALGVWRYQNHAAEQAARAAEIARKGFYRAMDSFADRLRLEPGFVVYGVTRSASPPWTIICLRDELARTPQEILEETGGDPAEFTVLATPYISLDPTIVAKRVQKALDPPPGVTMFFERNIVRLMGSASMDWILEARQKALLLPGVKGVDISGVSDPRMQRMEALVREVESAHINFPLGHDTPRPDDAPKLVKAVEDLVRLEALAGEMGLAAAVTIYGHADALGNEQRNYELSQNRARTLAAMLHARGSSMPVAALGLGPDHARQESLPPEGAPDDRRIELKVRLTRATSADDLLR